jgi:hypothetical protein
VKCLEYAATADEARATMNCYLMGRLLVVFGSAVADRKGDDCTYLHVRQPVFTFGANALTLFFLLAAVSCQVVEVEVVDMTRWAGSRELNKQVGELCKR